jgi:hypothetical protein
MSAIREDPRGGTSPLASSVRARRAVRPVVHHDHENRHPRFRIVGRDHWRPWQIRPPAARHVARNIEHQVRVPALALIVEVLLILSVRIRRRENEHSIFVSPV